MKRLTQLLGVWGRLVFVLFLLAAAFSFAMFQGGFVSWFIFYTILPFVLYSLLLAVYPLSAVSWSRETDKVQLRRGESVSSTIRMKRRFPFPLLYTVLTEKAEGPLSERSGEGERKLVMLGFRQNASWTFAWQNMPRGEYMLEGIEIEIADFFGWIRKKHFVPLPQRITVYPRVVDIPYQSIDVRFDEGAAAAPFAVVKDTTMASGSRDYQPGDRLSWIHWKSFARTQTLQTKEFESRQSQDMVVLDDRQHSAKFELQVELVASILRSAVRANSRISYLSAGEKADLFPSIRTEGHFQQVLTHLAKVQPDADKPPAEVASVQLLRLQPPILLYVTGRLTEEMVAAIQRSKPQRSPCICLVLTEEGDEFSAEELTVHQSARARGFAVKTIRPENFASVFKEVNRL